MQGFYERFWILQEWFYYLKKKNGLEARGLDDVQVYPIPLDTFLDYIEALE